MIISTILLTFNKRLIMNLAELEKQQNIIVNQGNQLKDTIQIKSDYLVHISEEEEQFYIDRSYNFFKKFFGEHKSSKKEMIINHLETTIQELKESLFLSRKKWKELEILKQELL